MKSLMTSTAIAALAGVAALLAAFPAYAAPTVINACINITAPGRYILGNSLISAGGTCIDVQVSRVRLSLDGFTIEAAGLSVGQQGIFINRVESEISKVRIIGPGRITGFTDASCEAGGGSSSRGITIGTFKGVTSRIRVTGVIVDGN